MKNIFSKELRALCGLSFGHFNIDLYASLLTPLFPLIVQKLNISLALISSIIALGHLVSSILQPIFGFISDKLKHRVFMVWGLVLSSIFIPLSIKMDSVYLFISCMFIGMIGNAFFHPQVSSLIKDFNKNNPNLTSAMGIFLGLGTIGYAFGPYLGTFSIEKLGENNFTYLSLIGLFACVLMYFFVPKVPKKEYIIKENFFKIIFEIFKNKTCIYLLIVSVLKSALSISLGIYVPFLLEKYNISLVNIGLIISLFFVFGGLGTIYSPKLEKKIGPNGVIAFSFLSILPLTLLFLYMIKFNVILSILFFILIGFFVSLSVGIILVQAQKTMPNYTGVISGVMQGFSWGLGALTLSPLGFIAQGFGVETVLILLSVLALIVGFITKYKKILGNN